MDINMVFDQMLVLFIVMIIGYIANKKSILDFDVNKKVSSLLLNITAPALIISSVVNQTQKGNSRLVIEIIVLSIILYTVLPFIGKLLCKILKVKKEDKNLYEFMTIFSNVGFMGFPVVESIFGKEAVFFAAIVNLVFNVLCYSYGVYLISNDSKLIYNYKKLINPGIIFSLIAIVIYLLNIDMPIIVKKSTSLIGGVTTPLAMMLIGSSLGEMPIKEIFLEKKLYPYTIIKQIIVPIIFFFILKPFIVSKLILGVIIVVSAMPIATITIMFCNEYGGNINLASKAIFITTLCSVVTIPVLVYILFV